MKGLIFLLSVAALSGSKAFAGEAECLRDIMAAEGRTFDGVVTVGQAAVEKAHDERSTICEMGGVHRKHPIKEMTDYYLMLARQLIAHPSHSMSKGSDHWNKGTKPQFDGTVKRHTDGQVFYVLAPRGEK
jgi:hypothetical protein